MKVIDYKPQPIESLKGNWGIYEVTVEMPDGKEFTGSMQGDTHMWAYETFEPYDGVAKAPPGMKLNAVRMMDGKQVNCYIEDK